MQTIEYHHPIELRKFNSMGRSGGVVLLALVLISLLHSTPASASHKSYLLILDDMSSLTSLLAALTTECSHKILYRFNQIKGVGLQIDDGFVSALTLVPGVVAVIPDRFHRLYTTRSWGFLGLDNATYAAKLGEGVIIGNVDSGVWPESDSFRDDGLGIPSGWRGSCDAGDDHTFRCNSKLIGARFLNEAIRSSSQGGSGDKRGLNSPRDYDGHGTHTLSTAGGGLVPGASAFGHGTGTARGGLPRARVAAYKACLDSGCSSLDILAAIIAAVDDGVHVLSLSLGSDEAQDYAQDPLAIGAFYAIQKGVTIVCAGGNSGPQPGSIVNVAPWIFTVGAGTMDRDFPAYVTFGSGSNNTTMTIKGQSTSDSTLPARQQYPIISGRKANGATQSADKSALCLAGSLDPAKVSGKIVVCSRGSVSRVEKGKVVKEAGGVGMVLCNDAGSGDMVSADQHLIAAAHCSYSQCTHLFNHLQLHSTTGYITATDDAQVGVKPAPVVADFSSRGPNPVTLSIIKPDIMAPGVSVIAAYSEAVSPTGLPFDDRRVPYNILSGTSMACPHIAGIAGLLKANYPDWTPAMIKSAIMTTATTLGNDGGQIRDETGNAATPFSCGSGHVNPVLALDPGLVYDTTPRDYANFICSTQTQSRSTYADYPLKCGQVAYGRPEDLNYPSIAAACLSWFRTTAIKRRVRNVAAAPSTYTATVTQPAAGVKVTVEPTTLTFGATNEEKEFTVKLQVYNAVAAANYVFGSIQWSDGKHHVRSPIMATTKCP